MTSYRGVFVAAAALAAVACGRGDAPATHEDLAAIPAGEMQVIRAVEVPALLEASGTAEPFAEATLSTKLMGTVNSVRVREGDHVRQGTILLELDARDLDAKAAQVEASLSEAKAVLNQATVHAERMRKLFAEEAATKAQLDAAETGLARAQAGVEAANAAAAELRATRDYAVVRAPFDATVVRRMVDPGAFAAPGAPLVTVQDSRRLRVAVTAPPDAVRDLSRGGHVAARIENVAAEAVVEGVVPAGGSLFTVNAIVDNPDGLHLAGSAATLALSVGVRTALFVPVSAVQRQGDLTGLYVGGEASSVVLRWVRLGAVSGDSVEVLSGLRDGESVLVPSAVAEVN